MHLRILYKYAINIEILNPFPYTFQYVIKSEGIKIRKNPFFIRFFLFLLVVNCQNNSEV